MARNVSFTKMLFVLVLLTVLGMAVAFQRIEVTRLGYAVHERQQARSALQEQNRRLLYQVNLLSAPDRLVYLVKQGKIKLVAPSSLLLLEQRSMQRQGIDALTPRGTPALQRR